MPDSRFLDSETQGGEGAWLRDAFASYLICKRVTKSIFFGEPPIAKNVVGGADR